MHCRFYRHLNMDACLWTFESYYDMTELVQKCGGSITTDGQVKDTVQSHMSVKVPLFVSYIYHSPTAAGGWMHFDHRSSLRLTFVYDTAVLWKDGVGPPATSLLKGNLYPTSIRIRDSDRKLVVNFRTKARFRGQFIMKREITRRDSKFSYDFSAKCSILSFKSLHCASSQVIFTGMLIFSYLQNKI